MDGDTRSSENTDDVVAAIRPSAHGLPEIEILSANLSERHEALLRRVLEAIAIRQRAFLEFGFEWLWACGLGDLARDLGVHVATISRLPAEWSIETPHGTLPIRAFMDSGGARMVQGRRTLSHLAVEACIRRMIRQEDPRARLSDDRIAELLEDIGVRIARRTVAKYRQVAGIPASHERAGWSEPSTVPSLERFRTKTIRPMPVRRRRSDEERAEREREQQREAILRYASLPRVVARHLSPLYEGPDDAPVATDGAALKEEVARRVLRQILAGIPDSLELGNGDLARLLGLRGVEVTVEDVGRLLDSMGFAD